MASNTPENPAETPKSVPGNGQTGQARAGQAPAASEQQRAGSTVLQLKQDIDSGRTGEKVNHPDFAAAPLGTDDEAGGTPNSPEQIHLARQQENTRPLDAPGTDQGTNPARVVRGEHQQDRTSYWVGIAIAAAGAGAIGFLLATA